MILNKEKWIEEDKVEFLKYLGTLGQPEKVTWGKNILKTNSPVLVIPTAVLVEVATEIRKGNAISFLELKMDDYYETIALFGMIISRMKSLDDFKIYLEYYLNMMNCWAHCDLLKLSHLFEESKLYFSMSEKYRTDQRVMVRRLSLFILFQYVKDKTFLPTILDSLLSFEEEHEYYVIMMAGWLLSECIILYQDVTLDFIEKNKLNIKIQNKAIQKCRESNRLSQEEKDYLLRYKMKKLA